MNITSGKIESAKKVVVYGPEGIGKSTFAAQFPNPLFIDTEGSTKYMDVRRMDKPTSWEMLRQELTYVKQNPQVCGTLIIDTIDWAEQLCIDDICSRYQKKGIEDFGYGNGYVYEKEEFGRFLNSLEEIVQAGVHVVLTAHAQMRKFEQPDEMGALRDEARQEDRQPDLAARQRMGGHGAVRELQDVRRADRRQRAEVQGTGRQARHVYVSPPVLGREEPFRSGG